MSFPIEECTSPDDAAPCLAWVDAAVREIYAAESVPQSGESARRFLLRSLGQPGSLLLLAKDEKTKKAIGFLFLAPREDGFLGVRVPFLYLLFVLPEFRRLGAARDLLLRAEKWLVGQGARMLVAPAIHNDDAIISMGERRGYLREREWMVKEL